MIRGGGLGPWFDAWLTLLAFQPVILIPQTLDFCLGIPQVTGQGLNEIEQPGHKFAGTFVGDAGEVKVIKHGARSGPGIAVATLLYTACHQNLTLAAAGTTPLY